MVDSLPNELTEPQRKKVRQLLQENEAIFSKGEYDIGRTPLVEYRIDTGTHRPIIFGSHFGDTRSSIWK